MRIVLDTNVLVSSLWGGPQRRILALARGGRLRLLVSPDILGEYFAVLSRFEILESDQDVIEALFADPERTELLSPSRRVRAIPEDPPDNRFLECAWEGRADCIVSGDKHLLRLKAFHGIPILAPRRFLDAFEGGGAF